MDGNGGEEYIVSHSHCSSSLLIDELELKIGCVRATAREKLRNQRMNGDV